MIPSQPYYPTMQAISLEEIVKQSIYQKYLEADKLLQGIDKEKHTKDTVGNMRTGPVSDFRAAVLAEYRMIRPKLDYAKELTDRKTDLDAFEKLLELDAFIKQTVNEPIERLIEAHLAIGLFLEKDGITKYERRHRNLDAVMLG